jgi:TRAP-type C4-dicarboxylate transport system permease small subunit
MIFRQILRILLGGVLSTGAASAKRRAKDISFALFCYAIAGWCILTAVLVFAIAAWLALTPEIGPALAALVVGGAFLVLAGVAILVQLSRQRTKRVAERLDEATDAPSELQQQIMQSITANIGPILLTAVATFLVSRLTRRD